MACKIALRSVICPFFGQRHLLPEGFEVFE
jgi:hypothetical protein